MQKLRSEKTECACSVLGETMSTFHIAVGKKPLLLLFAE